MNFLFISPNYPLTYFKFCGRLKAEGFSVFGIGDTPAHEILPELRDALTEYVFLPSLGDYASVLAAAQGLTDRYGALSGIESNNEYWLSLDAALRRDLGVPGLLPDRLRAYQHKSEMKAFFKAARVPAVPFCLAREYSGAAAFTARYGFPVFAKPDKGVGAGNVQKISDDAALRAFFAEPKTEDYMIEIYIEGALYSYDGLTDLSGNIVFEAAHAFDTPVDRLKETGAECVYRTLPVVPEALSDAGRRAVKAFGLTGRFFHIEFFEALKPIKGVADAGEFVGLEVNMRPAGGYTPEMIAAAKGIDPHALWAACMVGHTPPPVGTDGGCYCVNIGRHKKNAYRFSGEELRNLYPENLVFAGLTDIHDNPFGNFEVIGKFQTTPECEAFINVVTEKA